MLLTLMKKEPMVCCDVWDLQTLNKNEHFFVVIVFLFTASLKKDKSYLLFKTTVV